MKKRTIVYFCVISFLVFTSFHTKDERGKLTDEFKKQIIENTTHYKVEEITFDKINIATTKNKFKESVELYSVLHTKEDYGFEHELLLANFTTTDGHFGIISYAKISECDHGIDYYFLYVCDKNGIVSQPMTIQCEDNSITIFEIDFKFLNESTIQLSEKTSSEWAIDDDKIQDTLFTDRVKINFLKNPFDTIERKQFQKILKK